MKRAGRWEGIKGRTGTWMALTLGAALVCACAGDAHVSGAGDDDDQSPFGEGSPNGSDSWVELAPGTISLAGGTATTVGGIGHAGGSLHVISRGGIDFDAA